MTVPAIQKIRETQTLTIFQKIVDNDSISVNEFIDAGGDAVWLIREIALGSKAEFTRLCDSTRGVLFGLLLRVLTNSREAEETLEKLYAELRREAVPFGSGREKQFVWLIGIAPAPNLKRFPLDRQFSVIEITNRNVIAV